MRSSLWKFLETVHDRCERDDSLCRTWYPAIAAENGTHREWFNRDDNRNKFKQQFPRQFILNDTLRHLATNRALPLWRGFIRRAQSA